MEEQAYKYFLEPGAVGKVIVSELCLAHMHATLPRLKNGLIVAQKYNLVTNTATHSVTVHSDRSGELWKVPSHAGFEQPRCWQRSSTAGCWESTRSIY